MGRLSDENSTDVFQQALGSISGGRVLDVATGRGNFIAILQNTLKDYSHIVGIDNSERAIQAASETFKQDPIRFICMEAEALEFDDQSFDTVCISNSLHHLIHLSLSLAEMKRVLKPGGHFIISEMCRDVQNEAQLTHVYMHHWWGQIDTASGITHNETFTRQEIIHTVQNLGLNNLRLYDYAQTEGDAKDPDLARELEGIIDTYQKKAACLPDCERLYQRGEELRQRVRSLGYQPATLLIAVGEK